MKFLTLLVITTLLTGLSSCRTNPVKTSVKKTRKVKATKQNETKIYILQKKTENSDFNYSKLDSIDRNIDTLNVKNLMPIFEPISGHYNYYQFLSTYIELAFNPDGPAFLMDFHDILIIKTDNEHKIIDAYQYTLEWSEAPLQYDMFKSSINNISLTNNMGINQLKFIRTYDWTEDDKELDESGIIKLK